MGQKCVFGDDDEDSGWYLFPLQLGEGTLLDPGPWTHSAVPYPWNNRFSVPGSRGLHKESDAERVLCCYPLYHTAGTRELALSTKRNGRTRCRQRSQ